MTYNTGEILMPRFRPRGILAKSATEDLFRHTLSRVPTVYGRLAYLASLRDSNTGVYRHHGLSATFGREEAANALRECHELMFREWLTLAFPEKYEDLGKYIASVEAPRAKTVSHWLQSKIYRTCIPSVASAAEKEFFISDLEMLLVAFSHGSGDGQTGPGTSPPE